jgi:amino acid permease
MAGGSLPDKYTSPIAFIFIFNLIVGTGVLTLPYGFNEAGIGYGLIILFVCGFLGYVTATFLIEGMSIANAAIMVQRTEEKLISGIDGRSGDMPMNFLIEEKVEYGMMASFFLGKAGHRAFAVILIIYLFGDLAIYGVAIPSSVSRLTPDGVTIGSVTITQGTLYNIYLLIFAILMVPLSSSNFQKTKYLQLITMSTRQVALFSMVIIVFSYIYQLEELSPPTTFFNTIGIPKLLGATIYSFMCHHSLPGIVTPLADKRKIYPIIAGDMGVIYIVYSVLCTTAVIAFGHVTNPTCLPKPGPPCQIQPLYTFNFLSYNFVPIAYFLQLYPVFTLSTNFPLIVITLRNNILELIGKTEHTSTLLRVCSSTVLIAASAAISAILPGRIQLLTKLTGSFAGLAIMYIFPPILVLMARRYQAKMFGKEKNPFTSPFSHVAWIMLVLVFSAGLLVFSVYDVYLDITALINANKTS